MIAVALAAGITLGCVSAASRFLLGTVYSAGYNEAEFHALRTGMTPDQVEQVIGQPLAKAPWGERTENWQYSAASGPMFFHRRWVIFTDGKVSAVVCDIFDR
jgi:outer membrane protein assembly factor BamE (lipoprotein component of BamABCDE complex)